MYDDVTSLACETNERKETVGWQLAHVEIHRTHTHTYTQTHTHTHTHTHTRFILSVFPHSTLV